MYKVCFYVPVEAVESVKNALFQAGAGKIGAYEGCAWQTLGEGQFLPLEGSKPVIGQPLHPQKVPEYKVEMVCSEENIRSVVKALYKVHPYEEPVYQIIRLEKIYS